MLYKTTECPRSETHNPKSNSIARGRLSRYVGQQVHTRKSNNWHVDLFLRGTWHGPFTAAAATLNNALGVDQLTLGFYQ